MMSLQDLKSIHYDEVDWTVLLHRLMFKPNSTHIIKDDHMVVTRPSYIATLKDLMTKTAPRTVANLIGFDILLNTEMDALSQINVTEEVCIIKFKKLTLFFKATEAIFAQQYFSKEKKVKAEDLVNKSIREMKVLLSNVKWMDKTTKSKAIEKVDSMLAYVGYDDEVFDKEKMKTYHDSFLEDMDHKSFFQNQESNF